MTCIVGITDAKNGKVIIGGDSAGVAGDRVVTRADQKVFRNSDFLFGCTTSFRMIQLLRYSLKVPPVREDDMYAYMCTDFMDAVRKCFREGGYIRHSEEGDELGGQFLVGFGPRLFQVEPDFQIAESANGLYAIGCGADFALGALYAIMKRPMGYPRTEASVEMALEASANFALGVRGPFEIEHT